MLVYLDDSLLVNIADSVRHKDGTSNVYTPAQLAQAIENLDTGGEEVIIPMLAYPIVASDVLEGKQGLNSNLEVIEGNIKTITLNQPELYFSEDGTITATLDYESGYIAEGGTVQYSMPNAFRHIYTGSGAPASSLGVDGDIYLQL